MRRVRHAHRRGRKQHYTADCEILESHHDIDLFVFFLFVGVGLSWNIWVVMVWRYNTVLTKLYVLHPRTRTRTPPIPISQQRLFIAVSMAFANHECGIWLQDNDIIIYFPYLVFDSMVFCML